MPIDWKKYELQENFFDELISSPGNARQPARQLVNYLSSLSEDDINSRKIAADSTIKDMGVSFTVYTEGGNIDRAWPFDIVPRVISKAQWDKTAAGLKQRLKALNMFIDDLYHDQNIIRDGIIPEFILKQSKNYLKECEGVSPRFGAYLWH